jgi:hypothetical protein
LSAQATPTEAVDVVKIDMDEMVILPAKPTVDATSLGPLLERKAIYCVKPGKESSQLKTSLPDVKHAQFGKSLICLQQHQQ